MVAVLQSHENELSFCARQMGFGTNCSVCSKWQGLLDTIRVVVEGQDVELKKVPHKRCEGLQSNQFGHYTLLT